MVRVLAKFGEEVCYSYRNGMGCQQRRDKIVNNSGGCQAISLSTFSGSKTITAGLVMVALW